MLCFLIVKFFMWFSMILERTCVPLSVESPVVEFDAVIL